ncbi:membrane protein insertase YidC, partial [Georgenia sp. 10Sc9-8]|nr:membrane protein insertase YidC [Georgenia halotolerans]
MGWFDSLLLPIMIAVAWIMVRVHDALLWLGMPAESSWAWILSIVGLVVAIRVLLIPLFFKQIKASRGMQILQPEIQKLQKKYKNKTDPASRQAMQQEMMGLYRKHGTNPFSSCLPILAQMPIFFALFRVLYSLSDLARGEYSRESIGPLTREVAAQIENSTLFGARLSDWFLMPEATASTRVVTVVLIIAMSVTTFTTQRQLTMKNMPASALDNPMARQQKMLMYILPLVFAFTGVNFPIGVLIYWLVTNLWSMGQQFYTIRRMPAPGSEAAQKLAERKAKKRARKGLPPEDEAEKPAPAPEQPRGQRVQPKRKDRQKKSGQRPADDGTPERTAQGSEEPAGVERSGSVPAGSAPSPDHADEDTPRGKDGLTAEERAQKRYEERAARRRAEAQRARSNQQKRGPSGKA